MSQQSSPAVSRCESSIALGVGLMRTTSSLKVGVLLVVCALCVTLYMMLGSLGPPETPTLSPLGAGTVVKTNVHVSINGERLPLNSANGWEDSDEEEEDDDDDDAKGRQGSSRPSPQKSSSSPGLPDKRNQDGSNQTQKAVTGSDVFDRNGIAPVPCRKVKGVSNMLALKQPQFLPHFKNPCWREKVTDPEKMYRDNGFAGFSSKFRQYLTKLHDYWHDKTTSSVSQYRLRCLPYFFLAGQPKCGSTDLYLRLVSHPDVVTTPTKEPHWWGKYSIRSVPFSDYVDLFDDAALKIDASTEEGNNSAPYHPLITGDGSVSTLWSNDGWWRHPENCGRQEPLYTNAHYIHRLLPEAKILVILRNPTDRLYSDFLYFHESAKNQQVFHSEVKKSIIFFKQCVDEAGLRACLYNFTVSTKSRVRLRLGMYALYMEEWLSLFPRDQIHVVRLEDYAMNPLRSIKQIHKFLELRSLTSDENEEVLEQPKANTRREKDRKLGRMYPKTRLLLENFYRPFNQKLAHILGDDRFLWEVS